MLAIAATLRRPARCCSSAGRTLQAAVRCRPTPQQRCELQRSRPSLQRCEELQCSAAAAAVELYTSDFHRTSVQLSSVELPSDVRPTSLLTSSSYVPADVIVLPSCVLHTSLLTSLLASSCYHLVPWCPTCCRLDILCPVCCRPDVMCPACCRPAT